MLVWYKSVAPALLPFLALMPVLTGEEACGFYGKLFSGWMRRIFALPGAAAPALIVGMISGSPAGAVAIRRLTCSGKLEKNDACRLAAAVCGLSPAYLVLGIGQEMYGSAALGWRLAGAQASIQLIILFATRRLRMAEGNTRILKQATYIGGMKSVVEAVLVVCGYMVFFGAVSTVIGMLLGERMRIALLLLTDLPGGSAALSVQTESWKLIAQSAAIGFGGLCIAFQNMNVLHEAGVSWRIYIAGRLATSAMFILCGVFLADGAAGWKGTQSGMKNIYVFSLFFACGLALPAMFFLCRNLFLNNQKSLKK